MSERYGASENLPNKLAETISELPKLPQGYVRAVHLTNKYHRESLLRDGLNYSKYGMGMSVARAWGDEKSVEYWSDDPRFFGENTKALVMDISDNEWLLHNNVTKCPGVITPDKIVGFVDSVKPE